MKYLFVLLFISNPIIAQVNGYVEYNYRVMHIINYETKSVLSFDTDQSSYITFRDASKNDFLPKLISTEGNSRNYLLDKDFSNKPVFYIDKINNVIITKVRKFRENYVLTEAIPQINWDIKSEFKLLGEFRCQKAVGYFRGRTYTVWFTESIPVSFGPWKLQGLPGLILEAKDDSDRYFYRATKIKSQADQTIEIPELRTAIPLKTFITEIEPEKFREIDNRIQAKADRSITISQSIEIDRSSFREVIYEWEEKEFKKK